MKALKKRIGEKRDILSVTTGGSGEWENLVLAVRNEEKAHFVFELISFIDLFGVLCPDFRAVWDYRQEQPVLKQRILRYEMHETKSPTLRKKAGRLYH